MTYTVVISSFSELTLLGTRFIAKRIRKEIESALAAHQNISIDFKGINVTQSFIDELLGPIVLQEGPLLLEKINFKECSENAKAVIQYVLSARMADYLNRKSIASYDEKALLKA